MPKTTRRQNEGLGSEAPRFHNRLYRAELGRTPAGSPVLRITPANPTGRYAQHRQIAAFIYELAAEMERRSEGLGARWVVSPDVANARLVLELTADHETAPADEFITSVLADHDLA